jgi:hypothetical protein
MKNDQMSMDVYVVCECDENELLPKFNESVREFENDTRI